MTAFAKHRKAIRSFYADREYFRRLVSVALPIALQNFIMSSLNLVGVMMIGQLGEASVAAVGLANQIYFLLNLLMFGITSGSAMFTAQLWGKQDIPNIRRVLGLSLLMGVAGSLVFVAIAQLAPAAALGVYSEDPEVVALGSQYLRIYGLAFPFVAVTFSFAAVLRSTGDVKTPLVISMTALSLNTLLSYGLVLGNFGLPELGVRGAGIAILVARIVECASLAGVTYLRRSPVAVSWREITSLDLAFARKVLRPVLPVVFNEVLWALGVTAYNVVYAHIGTDSIAAMNIVSSIDNLAMVLFMGISNATAILVGNWIGAGDYRQAQRYAGRSLSLNALGALGAGGIVLLVSPSILGVYKVSPEVIQHARNILVILALLLWLRASNMLMFIGIFRAGGDTRFAFFLDAGIIWTIGVPLAFAGAFLFHLPIHWVYLLVMAEEATKWLLGIRRFISRKWIHNLAQGI